MWGLQDNRLLIWMCRSPLRWLVVCFLGVGLVRGVFSKSCDFPYFRQKDHFSAAIGLDRAPRLQWGEQCSFSHQCSWTRYFPSVFLARKPRFVRMCPLSQSSYVLFTIVICGCSLPIVFLLKRNLEEICGVTGSSKTRTAVILFAGHCAAQSSRRQPIRSDFAAVTGLPPSRCCQKLRCIPPRQSADIRE